MLLRSTPIDLGRTREGAMVGYLVLPARVGVAGDGGSKNLQLP